MMRMRILRTYAIESLTAFSTWPRRSSRGCGVMKLVIARTTVKKKQSGKIKSIFEFLQTGIKAPPPFLVLINTLK